MSVAKVWNDANNALGTRPDRVMVNLLANGEPTSRSLELTDEGGWVDTFYGLPIADEAGEEIAYTVAEEPVEGYAATVTGDAVQGYTVTNSLAETASYQVQYFYERDGAYTEVPDVAQTRQAAPLSTVSVTDADRTPDAARGRYVLDDEHAHVYEGVVAADGSLVLKVYFRQVFLITYDLNGGTLNGSGADVVEEHFHGDVICILEAPTRSGHSFDYWQGSAYRPGDRYTVVGAHRFVAQWKARGNPDSPGTSGTTGTNVLPRTADATVPAWPFGLAAAGVGVVAIGLRRRRGTRNSSA